jgi:solute carrier family 8 (sodium/calcium exchanger)
MIDGPARTGANTLLFFSLLLWAFLGVAIAADAFMGGIEKITSQETTKTIVLPSGETRTYTITVWNATVANLTLMALGSSAPEILLSVIEIFSSGFYAGELGPSTIVGSAAFNMLVISAVCVIAIPDGTGRSIKELPVFYITALFSLLAYVWLIVILVLITPNVIDIWEGVATFLAFPALVWVAYKADIAGKEPEPAIDDSPEGSVAAEAVGYGKDGRPISRTDIAKVLALKSVEVLNPEEQVEAVVSMLLPAQSRAFYRQAATRFALGIERSNDGGADLHAARRKNLLESDAAATAAAAASGLAVIQWAQPAITCREAQGDLEVLLERSGNLRKGVSIGYSTKSGTATEGVDFLGAHGRVEFAPGARVATIVIKIVDDDEEEEDETFTIELGKPSPGCIIGDIPVCEVTIQDDDGPGELHFEHRELETVESDGSVSLVVMRTHGCQGRVMCHWSTRDGSSVAPSGFASGRGQLVFEEGVTQMAITVDLKDTGAYHRDDEFEVTLSSAGGGARFVTDAVSRTRRSTLTSVVRVLSDASRVGKVDQMLEELDFNLTQQQSDSIDEGSWAEQFEEAFEVPSDGSSVSLVLYFLALPWKLLGALVPPPRLAQGWLCFSVALCFIGLLTALIGDLASHMGCCMGLTPSVTAITFVALGTSLPDTFASMSAATSEPYADASIVNITGSNSVNVFLGLGLPWMVAAIYWAFNGTHEEGMWRKRYNDEPWYNSDYRVGFAVPAGDLAYSVQVFVCTSLVCLGVLVGRRRFLGHELGGPVVAKWLTFFLLVGLWFLYIYLSVANAQAVHAASAGASASVR